MITTQFNPFVVNYACKEIRVKGKEPIIYVSINNIKHLINNMMPTTITYNINENNNCGYVGKYKGTPVYVTDEVDDYYVIVPQYKEEKYE